MSVKTGQAQQWSADCEHLSVLIERTMLDNMFCSTWQARPAPEDFPVALDLRSPATRTWVELVRWAATDLDRRSGIAGSRLGAARFEELIVSGLLTAQHGDAPHVRMGQVAPVRLRRVVDYIEGHADEPLTTAHLARIAEVSARTLQAGFREHYGVSPTVYLRNIRLDRVHEMLCKSGDDSVSSVIDTALRWGFTHPPRFAAAYRSRFGVLPSETLRGARYRSRAIAAPGNSRDTASPPGR
jgi:AraC-like DNA-binding protein